MVQLRFARQDELALLAHAVSRCYSEKHPDKPRYNVEQLRYEVETLGVWWPGCLLAEDDTGEVVGVLLTARRDKKALIHRFSVHESHEHQGLEERMLKAHLEHLGKEGIKQVYAEVPEDGPTDLFEHQSYEPLMRLQDLEQQGGLIAVEALNFVQRFAVEELIAFPGLWSTEVYSWSRSYKTLHACRDRLSGMGLMSRGRLVAAIIYDTHPVNGACNIRRFGRLSGGHGLSSLSLLVRVLTGDQDVPLRISRMHAGEVPMDLVAGWGFVPTRTYMRYRALPDN